MRPGSAGDQVTAWRELKAPHCQEDRHCLGKGWWTSKRLGSLMHIGSRKHVLVCKNTCQTCECLIHRGRAVGNTAQPRLHQITKHWFIHDSIDGAPSLGSHIKELWIWEFLAKLSQSLLPPAVQQWKHSFQRTLYYHPHFIPVFKPFLSFGEASTTVDITFSKH